MDYIAHWSETNILNAILESYKLENSCDYVHLVEALVREILLSQDSC